MTSFACNFEPSNLAPIELGPKQGISSSESLSDKPATNGASGPTTTKSIFNFLAKSIIPSISIESTL